MDPIYTLNGIIFAKMVNSGAANLKMHVKEINELNVFPIPDGDTGDNMLMTIMGGVHSNAESDKLCDVVKRVASGMLMSARGNSGVILSQFFEGIKNGVADIEAADVSMLGQAFKQGVYQAYSSVMTPTEGTILTVVREATEYACSQEAKTAEDFLKAFILEAKSSLARTPELLPVLKNAGVVDSGAAGLIYIIEGMLKAVRGEDIVDIEETAEKAQELNIDVFDEDSVLEFGYCTELLVRLQRSKTDIEAFDVNIIKDYLKTIGDSIVTVRNGSVVKIHVHTMTPQNVLGFCQQYGEFLKVKIENMSLQHNNTVIEEKKSASSKERKKYGVVAVASGEGLKQTFLERGADIVVDGGQSMNPSTEDFIDAFDEVNADTIFVFPNNGNIILTAEQASKLYKNSDVRIIRSTTIGAGYASLSMLDTGSGNTDEIVDDLTMAMEGVITAEISHCIREASMDGKEMTIGDYIGFIGKDILSVSKDRLETACCMMDKAELSQHDICIVIYGKTVSDEEAEKVKTYIDTHYKGKEIYIINGGQDVYDYIIIIE